MRPGLGNNSATANREWKPHKRQEQFASLPDSIFEALYGGAAGGGKSELLLMLPIIRGFYQEPRFKGIIFRRTFPELESEIIVRSRDWYSLAGGKYNEEKKRWSFPSGALIQFGHVEYESDVRKYDTAEYNYMAFDELTSFTQGQYVYLSRTRCRSSSSRLPAIVRAATNPGNIGHAWVRDLFINPAPKNTIIIDKKTSLKRIFIQSFAEDNPYLMQNDPQYVNRLESLPEAERAAKRYGSWDSFEGQVFSDYREMPSDGEPANANHICKPFQIPDWWLRFLAVDWGYSAMTIGLWGALSPEDRLYIYREYAKKEAKTSTWATEIGNLSIGEKFTDVILCSSAWQKRGDEVTINEQFTRYSGLLARQSDNDRIAGKMLLQEYLRWKEAPSKSAEKNADKYDPETAMKILRNQGTSPYNVYVDSFREKKESAAVLPRLQIFPDCVELRRCIPLCIYGKKSNLNEKPAEDVREFNGDDPYDCVRYLIMGVNHYLGTLKDFGAARRQENDLINQLRESGDWNAYYRGMEKLERKQIPATVPIPRFGRQRFVD
jgi:hypothetical protein